MLRPDRAPGGPLCWFQPWRSTMGYMKLYVHFLISHFCAFRLHPDLVLSFLDGGGSGTPRAHYTRTMKLSPLLQRGSILAPPSWTRTKGRCCCRQGPDEGCTITRFLVLAIFISPYGYERTIFLPREQRCGGLRALSRLVLCVHRRALVVAKHWCMGDADALCSPLNMP